MDENKIIELLNKAKSALDNIRSNDLSPEEYESSISILVEAIDSLLIDHKAN